MLAPTTHRRLCWLLLVTLPCACSPGRMDVVGLSPGSLSLNMVAHWTCDQATGPTLADVSGNGHDGTLDGASWGNGRFGGGLHFDPGNSVAVPGFPQPTRRFSVALWYRAPAGEFDDSYHALIGTEIASVGGWEMSVRLSGSDSGFRFDYPIGGDASASMERVEGAPVDVYRWLHLVAVVDGEAMHMTLYRDGEVVADQAIDNLIQSGSPTLYLGRWVDGGQPLDGDLDDIVIFNRALVAAEVSKLFAQPAPLP